MTVLHKSGDKSDVNNYRPISCLPLLNKIFEKLLYSRLYSFFVKCDIFSTCQYGFLRGVNTSNAVNDLLENIYKAMNKNEYLGAVFLDLSKAFDTVSHDVLLKKLEHYGIRGNALLLLKSYLTSRKQFVTFDGHRSEIKDVRIGVPQGSVLGPLLFLVYINDLPRSVRRLSSILFADDTTLHFSHKNIYSLCDSLTADLTHVKNWLLANKLTLNERKTYFIIFSLRKVPDNIRVVLGNHTLDQKSSGKFLGVLMDNKLTFSEHINMIVNKIAKVIAIIYRLKEFFPSYIIKQLYHSVVSPHFNYCITASGCISKNILQPFILMQKRLVRIITS